MSASRAPDRQSQLNFRCAQADRPTCWLSQQPHRLALVLGLSCICVARRGVGGGKQGVCSRFPGRVRGMPPPPCRPVTTASVKQSYSVSCLTAIALRLKAW